MPNANPNPATRFSKDNQPANKGRKRSILRQLEELTGEQFNVELSQADKYRIIESLLEKDLEELKQIFEDDERPVFMRLVANAIRTDMTKGSMERFETILNRVYGKQTAKLDINHTGAITHITADVSGILKDFIEIAQEPAGREIEGTVSE